MSSGSVNEKHEHLSRRTTPTVSLTCCVPQRPEQSVRSGPPGPPQGRQGGGNEIQRNILQLSVILLNKSCESGSAGRCFFWSSIMWLLRPDRSRFTVTEVMFFFPWSVFVHRVLWVLRPEREAVFFSAAVFEFRELLLHLSSLVDTSSQTQQLQAHTSSVNAVFVFTCFTFCQVIRLNVFCCSSQTLDELHKLFSVLTAVIQLVGSTLSKLT